MPVRERRGCAGVGGSCSCAAGRASRLTLSAVAKYRYVAGFWFCLAAAAWSLMVLGAGLNAMANNPDRWVTNTMIGALVLSVLLAALFIRLALRFRRKRRYFAKPSY